MKLTQCERLHEWLKQGHSVTGLEAWSELGIYRLASRIHDLVKRGVQIRKERISVNNRFGESVAVVRYSLRKEGGLFG